MTKIETDIRAYDPNADVPVEAIVDQGERLLRAWAEVTGLRLTTCPWQALRDPYVAAVLRAHHRSKGGSVVASNPDMSRILFDGVEVYDRALLAVISHDRRIDEEKREAESAKPQGVPASFGAPPRMRRRAFR